MMNENDNLYIIKVIEREALKLGVSFNEIELIINTDKKQTELIIKEETENTAKLLEFINNL